MIRIELYSFLLLLGFSLLYCLLLLLITPIMNTAENFVSLMTLRYVVMVRFNLFVTRWLRLSAV